MALTVLGINFRTAPVELRERVSFSPEGVPAALTRLSAEMPGAEFALVSTCNRTELYVACRGAADRGDDLIALLLAQTGSDADSGIARHFYTEAGRDAARHLLAVAAGLDSMVVGENEILGQVKQAYSLAARVGTSGRMLNPLFHAAFRTAKRVHSETDISRGRVSVSSIAVEFAEKIFGELSDKAVMIVGAGETAELSLKSLVERGATDVLVLNRSHERGLALAERYGGEAIDFDLLPDCLARSDIVISSTGAPHCVVRAEDVRRAAKERRGRPILLIDIAVPRDVEAAVGRLDNVYLYHIDDLQQTADGNLARRRAALDDAWRIVQEEAAGLGVIFEGVGLGEMMRRFNALGDDVAESILARYLGKGRLAGLPGETQDEIRDLARSVVGKMLAGPREAMRKAAANGEWEEYARVVAALFRLERDKDADAPADAKGDT